MQIKNTKLFNFFAGFFFGCAMLALVFLSNILGLEKNNFIDTGLPLISIVFWLIATISSLFSQRKMFAAGSTLVAAGFGILAIIGISQALK